MWRREHLFILEHHGAADPHSGTHRREPCSRQVPPVGQHTASPNQDAWVLVTALTAKEPQGPILDHPFFTYKMGLGVPPEESWEGAKPCYTVGHLSSGLCSGET